MTLTKIAICGSHSCGKTTLVKALSKRPYFEDYPIIKEIAATFDPKLRLDMNVQFQIMQKQILTEVALVKKYGKFLSDRSVLDNIAYSTLVHKGHSNKEVYKKCYALSYSHLHSIFMPYDLLIFVDEVLEYQDAPHRNFSTYNDQKFIYDFIKEEIPTLNIPYITVKGNTKQRVDMIENYISGET